MKQWTPLPDWWDPTPADAQPDTNQIAQLAALCSIRNAARIARQQPLHPTIGDEWAKCLATDAMDLWEAARVATHAKRQKDFMMEHLADIDHNSWNRALLTYQGDSHRLNIEINMQSRSAESVLRSLFPAKSETQSTRAAHLVELVAYAKAHLKNCHLDARNLLAGRINANTIRELVFFREFQVRGKKAEAARMRRPKTKPKVKR